MSKFVKIAEMSDLSPGDCKSVEVEGQTIALFNVEGTFHAIDGICSHMGGPLGEGSLDGEVVTCPWHGAEFNVTTGAVVCPPAESDEKCFSIKMEGSDVLVELD